jgi:hypothetical protein
MPMAQFQITQIVFRGQSAAFGIYLIATLSSELNPIEIVADHSLQVTNNQYFP